jgi:hypothetical protein
MQGPGTGVMMGAVVSFRTTQRGLAMARTAPAQVLASLCALCLCLGTPTSVRADEPRADDEFRLVDVGALTAGRTNFLPERGPVGPTPDQVNDEERPLFGAEGEEPVRPYGTIDEVVELVKEAATPGGWDREGTSIGTLGSRTIAMRGPKALLDEAEALLSTIEREAGTLVTVDVVAFEAAGPAATAPQDFAAAVARGDARVVASARASGFSSQRVTAHSGGMRAFLADQDVEVAEKAQIEDPIVSVQHDGLSVDVRSEVLGDVVQVSASLWHARVESMTAREEESGQLEMPVVRASEARVPLFRAKPGEWSVLGGSGEVSFALRATVEAGAPRTATAPLPKVSGRRGERLAFRSWPLRALARTVASTRGEPLRIAPSSYTPPEPPELPEPAALFPMDAFVELVRATVDPPGWEREGAAIEVKNNVLFARTDDETARAIDALTRLVTDRQARSYRATATVVSFARTSPLDVVRAADAGGARLAAILGDAADARVEARASVRVVSGSRAGTFEGRLRSYLSDYEVEIAQDARIGNPVVGRFGEGLMLDVGASLAGSGNALVCEVRADRTAVREMRSIHTRHGDIDLPNVGLVRFRGGVVVPVGGARLLTTWTEEGRTAALVLRVDAE